MKHNLDLFIGIDPSINSTGVAIIEYLSTYPNTTGNVKYNYNRKSFYVIKDKLTKKESSIIDNYKRNDFIFIAYNKRKAPVNATSSDKEVTKTANLRSIIYSIKKTIKTYINNINIKCDINAIRCYVTIESNSYGSSGRTVSLIELAGLNYLIRNLIMDLTEENEFILLTGKKVNISYDLFIEPPTVIKKFATSRGDADKDLMLYCFSLKNEYLYNNLKEFKLDDIADAYFMALYGLIKTYNVSLMDLYNIEQSDNLDKQLISYKENKMSIKITKKRLKQQTQSEVNKINTNADSFIENI